MPVIYANKDELPERDPNELYETPSHVVSALIELFLPSIGEGTLFVDVGSGSGVWGKELVKQRPEATVVGLEINNDWMEATHRDWEAGNKSYKEVYYGDAFHLLDKFDSDACLFGNPPYLKDWRLMNELMEKCLSFKNVAFLLPAEYVGTVSRARIFAKLGMPATIYRVVPRINFKGRGDGNTANHAFHVWLPERSDCRYKIFNYKTKVLT